MQPRREVLEIDAYKPGKPVEELARELGLKDIVKMASNENPLGPSLRAIRAAKAALKNVQLYPDGAGFALKKKLSERHGLSQECFTLGNGSSDILSFALWAFIEPGDELLTAEVTFLMYPILAKVGRAKLVTVPLKDWGFDLEGMAKRIGPRTKLIFLCNPNNPTGTVVKRAEFQTFLKRVPEGTMVVVDEAYAEFVSDADFPDALEEIRRGRDNVIVLRTFSKIVGLAGLRIGYGVSTPKVADWLNRVRPPFNTNSVAQAAAAAALADAGHIKRTQKMVQAGRAYLCAEFRRLGLFFVPSCANFVMVQVPRSGEEIFQALLRKGVIVRTMGAYGLKDFLRVTVGTPKQNKRFIRELELIIN